jgi:hypothetical protein
MKNDSDHRRRRNHLVWIGLLISAAGLITYFTTFVKFPALRDFPWVNLPMVVLGVTVSLWAVARKRSFFSITGAVLSMGFASLLFSYVFSYSSNLPDESSAVAVGSMAPTLGLVDQNGTRWDLPTPEGHHALLIFYRGFW